MIPIRSGAWRWLLTDASVFAELGGHPESLTPETERIKINPAHSVFRRDGFYLKLNTAWTGLDALRSALFPRARREFRCAAALAARGIPLVEHCGYGVCGASNLLITREFAGGVPALNYAFEHFFRRSDDPCEWLEKLAGFWKKLLTGPVDHPDLHLGNILYSSATGTFVLVDADRVKPVRRLSFRRRAAMARGWFDLREFIPPAMLRSAAARAGFSADECSAAAEAVRRAECAERARRMRQFQHNYPKFVTVEDGLRRFRDRDGKLRDFPGGDGIPGNPDPYFRLDLAQIPHRRCAAARDGKIWLEPAAEWTGEPPRELREQLEFGGISPAAVRFVRDARGRAAVEPAGGAL